MLAPSQVESLNHYVNIGHQSRPGWLWQSAAYITAILGMKQVQDGIQGNIGEIGVWQGRYLFLLGLLSRPNEKVVGIDSFVHSHDPEGFIKSIKDCFESENATKGKLHLVRKNSLELTSEGLQNDVPGSYRLFSVDGGHLAHEALSDCRLVAPLMAPGGIMILDDILNATCPGVIEGTLDFLKSPEGQNFAPFCLVGNKMMVSDRKSADMYRSFLLSVIQQNKEISIFRDTAQTISDFPEGVFPALCGSDMIVITWSGDYLISDNGVPVLIRTRVCDMAELNAPEVVLPPVAEVFSQALLKAA